MNFLIIGDPIRDLKPKTDTSFALVREALMRAHSVHWCTEEDLFLWEGRVFARVDEITGCAENSHPATETIKGTQAINSYDGIWIRKDPPFDVSYMSLCWLLALEENNVPFLNKPSLLLRYHEKLLPLEAVEKGFLRPDELISHVLAYGAPNARATGISERGMRNKALLGHGGADVQKSMGLERQSRIFLTASTKRSNQRRRSPDFLPQRRSNRQLRANSSRGRDQEQYRRGWARSASRHDEKRN